MGSGNFTIGGQRIDDSRVSAELERLAGENGAGLLEDGDLNARELESLLDITGDGVIDRADADAHAEGETLSAEAFAASCDLFESRFSGKSLRIGTSLWTTPAADKEVAQERLEKLEGALHQLDKQYRHVHEISSNERERISAWLEGLRTAVLAAPETSLSRDILKGAAALIDDIRSYESALKNEAGGDYGRSFSMAPVRRADHVAARPSLEGGSLPEEKIDEYAKDPGRCIRDWRDAAMKKTGPLQSVSIEVGAGGRLIIRAGDNMWPMQLTRPDPESTDIPPAMIFDRGLAQYLFSNLDQISDNLGRVEDLLLNFNDAMTLDGQPVALQPVGNPIYDPSVISSVEFPDSYYSTMASLEDFEDAGTFVDYVRADLENQKRLQEGRWEKLRGLDLPQDRPARILAVDYNAGHEYEVETDLTKALGEHYSNVRGAIPEGDKKNLEDAVSKDLDRISFPRELNPGEKEYFEHLATYLRYCGERGENVVLLHYGHGRPAGQLEDLDGETSHALQSEHDIHSDTMDAVLDYYQSKFPELHFTFVNGVCFSGGFNGRLTGGNRTLVSVAQRTTYGTDVKFQKYLAEYLRDNPEATLGEALAHADGMTQKTGAVDRVDPVIHATSPDGIIEYSG